MISDRTILRTLAIRILVFTFIASSAGAILEKADGSFRLPSTIQPLQYNLSIEPNFANITDAYFNGTISIKLKVISTTDQITLHSRDLVINLRSIQIDDNGTLQKISNITLDTTRDFYTIGLFQPLLENHYVVLTIGNFSGRLKFDKVGFYLAKYRNQANKERDLRNGRFLDTYKETVKMSTYLIAFSVSDYRRTIQKGLFRVYAPPEVIQRGKTALVLSIANDALRVLENYTGIKYAMGKLDIFAVPSEYFEPGGMENWGLITLSEKNLICTNESTIDQIRKCTLLTGHEIAHQWFGNLVTPTWWNFLWLSEGFSTYMEYYTTSLMRPSWKMMDQFVVFLLHPLLKMDTKGSYYLNFHPQYAGALPVAYTSYFKGAAIVRMLEHILTQDTFQLGVRMYLKKFVCEIMSTWDSFPGYPVVNVSRNYYDGSITLSQESFGNSNLDHLWYIPINFVVGTSTLTAPQLWLKDKSVILSPNASLNWILVNKQNYIKNLLENLHRRLGFEEAELDEYLNKYSRISTITWSCNLNLFNCRDHALKAVRSWLSNGSKIAIDLEVPIMCGAMQLTSVDDWKSLYAKYESIPDGRRKWNLLTGLGCTSHKMFLERILDLIFTKSSGVSVADKKLALMRILQIGQTRVEMIFKYFVKHVTSTNEVYQELRVADVLCKYITSQQQLELLNMLRFSFPHSSAIRSCLNHVNKNMAWLREDRLKTIVKWFEDYERYTTN